MWAVRRYKMIIFTIWKITILPPIHLLTVTLATSRASEVSSRSVFKNLTSLSSLISCIRMSA